jgi:hypothetical protein
VFSSQKLTDAVFPGAYVGLLNAHLIIQFPMNLYPVQWCTSKPILSKATNDYRATLRYNTSISREDQLYPCYYSGTLMPDIDKTIIAWQDVDMKLLEQVRQSCRTSISL